MSIWLSSTTASRTARWCSWRISAFAQREKAASFFAEGRAAIGGDLPVNTAGGLLSEAYIHGFNLVLEAVRQLRGTAGARQVSDCEVGLVSAGGAAANGSAILLRAWDH